MKKIIQSILIPLCILITGNIYAQPPSLLLRPIENLPPRESDVALTLLAGHIAQKYDFTILTTADFSTELQTSGYTLKGRIDKIDTEKFFVLGIHDNTSGLLISGAARPCQNLGDILILIPEMTKEIFSASPLTPAMRPPSPEASILTFGDGVENLRLPFPDIQISSNLAIAAFTGSSRGESIAAMFSNELETRRSFNLVPLPSDTSHSPENPALSPRPGFILSGEITEKKHVNILKITLTPLDKPASHGGAWYFSDEKSLRAFIPLALDEALGYRTNGPWPMLLSTRKDTVQGVGMADTLNKGIEARSGIGETPLISAVRFGWADLTEALLEEKASLRAADFRGWTALHWAASSDNPDILNMLLQAQAPLNFRNSEGWTPLICAVIRGRKDNVQALLNSGANPLLRDKKGIDALRWAQIYGHSSIESLIRTHQTPKKP